MNNQTTTRKTSLKNLDTNGNNNPHFDYNHDVQAADRDLMSLFLTLFTINTIVSFGRTIFTRLSGLVSLGEREIVGTMIASDTYQDVAQQFRTAASVVSSKSKITIDGLKIKLETLASRMERKAQSNPHLFHSFQVAADQIRDIAGQTDSDTMTGREIAQILTIISICYGDSATQISMMILESYGMSSSFGMHSTRTASIINDGTRYENGTFGRLSQCWNQMAQVYTLPVQSQVVRMGQLFGQIATAEGVNGLQTVGKQKLEQISAEAAKVVKAIRKSEKASYAVNPELIVPMNEVVSQLRQVAKHYNLTVLKTVAQRFESKLEQIRSNASMTRDELLSMWQGFQANIFDVAIVIQTTQVSHSIRSSSSSSDRQLATVGAPSASDVTGQSTRG